MTVTLKIPQSFGPEREYIIRVVFDDMLGIKCNIEVTNRENTVLILPNKKTISIAEDLFDRSGNQWLTAQSLPSLPLAWFDSASLDIEPGMPDSVLPVIYGLPAIDISQEKNVINCDIDIFGSIFFMLSRYEEYVDVARDFHDRFAGSESVACKAGFVDTPVVDVYVELLWRLMRVMDPSIERKKHQFSLCPTHDVDRPYEYYLLPFRRIARTVAADILRRRSVRLASVNAYRWGVSKLTGGITDINNTFEYLMAESEKRSLVSQFYFIVCAGEQEPYFDRPYNLQQPVISRLMTSIHKRGHEIGLHPGYDTYLSMEKTCEELRQLQIRCDQLGIKQKSWGSRQHYLRWRFPDTQNNLESCGIAYDTTMGFPDVAGFRSGTSYEYPVFDLLERQELTLRERPMVAMDTIFLKHLSENKCRVEDCYDEMARLKRKCQDYAGRFTLLWHNSSLGAPEYRALYEAVLDS